MRTISAQVVRNDGICFILQVERTVGRSPCTQRISLRSGESMIRFDTDVDWQERHRLLKVHFESNIHSRNAICGMQLCHV